MNEIELINQQLADLEKQIQLKRQEAIKAKLKCIKENGVAEISMLTEQEQEQLSYYLSLNGSPTSTLIEHVWSHALYPEDQMYDFDEYNTYVKLGENLYSISSNKFINPEQLGEEYNDDSMEDYSGYSGLEYVLGNKDSITEELNIDTLFDTTRTTTIENEQEENDWDSWDDDWSEEEEVSDGNPITAEKFYKALNGYGKKVDNTSNMILLAFDAATPGRLAMIENVTLDTVRYLKNIEKWHNDCNWIHEKWKDGKRIQFWGMVGVRDIADILFGIENKGKLSIVDGNGKKLYAEVAKRLLPCIWYGSNIPYDYVNLAVVKASNPLTYKERKNWERVLTLACSMVKKNEKDRNKEEWNVALDKSAKDRSYLYGRLLAVADRIEYMTYDAKDNGRITNAKRYMSTFSQRPYETWKVIEENIQPYLAKLDVVKRKYYENLLSEICNLFDIDKFKENKKLDGLYLLGFHSQEYDLRFKKENSEEKKEEE